MSPILSLLALSTLALALPSPPGGTHHLPLGRVKRSSLTGDDLINAKIQQHDAIKLKYGIDDGSSKREKRAEGSETLAGNSLLVVRGDCP